MAVLIDDVRLELQLPESVISNDSINYAINKIEQDNINFVCAEVLRMVKRKYAGTYRLTIGKYEEWRDFSALNRDINDYMQKGLAANGSLVDDGFSYPDPRFSEDGI